MSVARPSPPLYMQRLESLKCLSYATSDLYLLRDTGTNLNSLWILRYLFFTLMTIFIIIYMLTPPWEYFAVCREIQSRAAVKGNEGGAAAGNRKRVLHKLGCQVFRAEIVHTSSSSSSSSSCESSFFFVCYQYIIPFEPDSHLIHRRKLKSQKQRSPRTPKRPRRREAAFGSMAEKTQWMTATSP